MQLSMTTPFGPPDKPRVRKIGSLVSQLMARRGYAQAGATEQLQATLEAAIGKQLAATTRVGKVNRGVLQIYASDSVTLQELNFQKRAILKRIQKDQPQAKIADLRFRIQALGR